MYILRNNLTSVALETKHGKFKIKKQQKMNSNKKTKWTAKFDGKDNYLVLNFRGFFLFSVLQYFNKISVKQITFKTFISH